MPQTLLRNWRNIVWGRNESLIIERHVSIESLQSHRKEVCLCWVHRVIKMIRAIHHNEGRKVKENKLNISYVKCLYRLKRTIDFLQLIKEYFA